MRSKKGREALWVISELSVILDLAQLLHFVATAPKIRIANFK